MLAFGMADHPENTGSNIDIACAYGLLSIG
jgi:hypothetical protein